MSAPLIPALLLLVAFAAPPARADEVSDVLKNAKANAAKIPEPPSKSATPTAAECGALAHPTHRGSLCDTIDDCIALCRCACTLDRTKWTKETVNKKDDGSTTCTSLPETGYGMLPPDSPDLIAVSSFPYIAVPAGVKALQGTIDGLQRLSDHLAASAERRRLNYTVRIGSCYRRHLEDSVPECGYVLKSAYMLDQVGPDPDKRKYWLFTGDPNNEGLAWPGRTPHSGAYGCDIILVDSRGQDCFDWRYGVDGAPSCSIPDAATVMAGETTAADVGAKRLSYEAWHFEWGANALGCVAPNCPGVTTGRPGNK